MGKALQGSSIQPECHMRHKGDLGGGSCDEKRMKKHYLAQKPRGEDFFRERE